MKKNLVLSLCVVLIAFMGLNVLAQGCAKNCCLKMKDVELKVENIKNGVKITYRAKDEETKQIIQSKLQNCSSVEACRICGIEGIKRKVKYTKDGAIMVLTSKDSAKVKDIQEAVKSEMEESKTPHKGCSREQQRKCGVIK